MRQFKHTTETERLRSAIKDVDTLRMVSLLRTKKDTATKIKCGGYNYTCSPDSVTEYAKLHNPPS